MAASPDDMHIKFDKLLINLSTTVKSYSSCDNDIHMIIEISKQMRQCNHRLLSRIDTIIDDRASDEYVLNSTMADRLETCTLQQALS